MWKDYYKILDVDFHASQKTIKTSYRQLAKKLHPDINKAKNATARFQQIEEAYRILSNEVLRLEYNAEYVAKQSSKKKSKKDNYEDARKEDERKRQAEEARQKQEQKRQEDEHQKEEAARKREQYTQEKERERQDLNRQKELERKHQQEERKRLREEANKTANLIVGVGVIIIICGVFILFFKINASISSAFKSNESAQNTSIRNEKMEFLKELKIPTRTPPVTPTPTPKSMYCDESPLLIITKSLEYRDIDLRNDCWTREVDTEEQNSWGWLDIKTKSKSPYYIMCGNGNIIEKTGNAIQGRLWSTCTTPMRFRAVDKSLTLNIKDRFAR